MASGEGILPVNRLHPVKMLKPAAAVKMMRHNVLEPSYKRVFPEPGTVVLNVLRPIMVRQHVIPESAALNVIMVLFPAAIPA